MDTTRHTGKVAIVTGAANGIGLATATRLAREGAHVIGFDMNSEALDKASVELDGLDVTLLRADLTKQADVDMVVARAGGRIDVLANVAGIMDHVVPLGDLDDELWDHVLAVNLTGPMRMARAVLPAMLAQGEGSIVTVASEASLTAGVSGTAYAASKHGVIGLVRSIAFYYGPQGIRSNAVLPGPVRTAIGASSAPRVPSAMERVGVSMASMPRTAEPDEIAATISWLASDEASDVNAAVLTVDGGWAA
jgi:NAD(P)-dependent dehydrogenase (short-subunit alcohol dehydrogenase family)